MFPLEFFIWSTLVALSEMHALNRVKCIIQDLSPSSFSEMAIAIGGVLGVLTINASFFFSLFERLKKTKQKTASFSRREKGFVFLLCSENSIFRSSCNTRHELDSPCQKGRIHYPVPPFLKACKCVGTPPSRGETKRKPYQKCLYQTQYSLDKEVDNYSCSYEGSDIVYRTLEALKKNFSGSKKLPKKLETDIFYIKLRYTCLMEHKDEFAQSEYWIQVNQVMSSLADLDYDIRNLENL